VQGLEGDVIQRQAIPFRRLFKLLDGLVGWGGEQNFEPGFDQLGGYVHDAGGLSCAAFSDDGQAW